MSNLAYIPRMALSAPKLSATKSTMSLRPSKTSVVAADLAYTPRLALSAQRLSATKSTISLRPSKTSVVAGKGAPTPKKANGVPPAIPGEPVDVNVAVTGAANSMGVPPAVAMSIVAAARSGDKKARKGIEEAAAVYKAAQKGDPVAKKQLTAVTADAKNREPAALQKAAFMAAAVGVIKGRAQYVSRKKAEKPAPSPVASTAGGPNSLGLPGWLLRFGGEPGPFLRYYQGIRG